MEELRKILSDMGLSSYKAETYLSLLKIESGTIQQIAKISKVPACKLYENLNWLYENGYISMILEKPLTYKANDPKTILKSEISNRKEKLNSIESELEKLNFSFIEKEKDIVQITSSREAFFKKMKESVSESRKSISYTSGNWKIDADLLNIFSKKIRKGVKIRALGPVNIKTKSNVDFIKKAGISVKNYAPETTRFSVFDKKTVIIRLRKDNDNYYSIWIKSEVLAEILENYFDMIWKNCR